MHISDCVKVGISAGAMANVILFFVPLICVAQASIIVDIYEDGEAKAVHSLSDCNYDACNKLCRKFGFTGGVCIGNLCSCDNSHKVQDKLSHSLDGCNPKACDQLCRRLGFTGGTCVGDKCDCDNFLAPKSHKSESVFQAVDTCSLTACDQLCRRLGFPGGACVGDKCDCDNFRENEGLRKHESADGDCNPVACTMWCESMGIEGGQCVAGICDCVPPNDMTKLISMEETTKQTPQIHLAKDITRHLLDATCDQDLCNDLCKLFGYIKGICIGNDCACYK